jgi:MarR family transcriptional regulator, lower aerobic nicotinate degradation pathway regulator
MYLRDLYAQPGHLIRRAQQIAVALFMEECAAVELTPVQYAALVAIKERPDIDATRLSALIAFDRSTVGSVLERLEARNLIERYASEEDKRIKLLKLTRSGAALSDRAEAAVLRAQERILKPLKPVDRARFMALLAQLVETNNEVSRAPQRASSSTFVPAKSGTQR